MLLLVTSAILFIVFSWLAYFLPAVYENLEESSRFYIGFKRGAGPLNRHLRSSYPSMRKISIVLVLLSGSWLVYLLIKEFMV